MHEIEQLALQDKSEGLQTLSTTYFTNFRLGKDRNAAIRALEIIYHLLSAVASDRRERYQCFIIAAKMYLKHDSPFQDISIGLSCLVDAL
jgi:hypothetical protein